ncbi:MAG TPA: nuclease-related domain-containing protein [Nitrospirota bacterium]|nr:nuclease-related domain-containing protein [Nitrospirota bacterium]
MARVLGESGRYVSEQSTQKLLRMVLLVYVFGCVISAFSGYALGAKQLYISIFVIVFIPIAFIYMKKKFIALEKERLNYRKGAIGEALVGLTLETFPDEYRVIHDLTTPYGNIDHVVVGPSGVYVIDTKNWRGVVTSDGNSGLMVNGKPTDKPETKNLTRMIMSIKDKVKVLCDMDPYVQGVLAFPSAHVDAKWGTTGAVHCMTDEKLYDYIVENKRGQNLSKAQIDSVSHAFLALARMDKGFET